MTCCSGRSREKLLRGLSFVRSPQLLLLLPIAFVLGMTGCASTMTLPPPLVPPQVPAGFVEPLPPLLLAEDDTPQAVLRSYAINAEGFLQCYGRYPALIEALRERGLLAE